MLEDCSLNSVSFLNAPKLADSEDEADDVKEAAEDESFGIDSSSFSGAGTVISLSGTGSLLFDPEGAGK